MLARAVAVAIVRYWAEHDRSQRELAERLRMKQPQVARLELGEVNPNIDSRLRISAALGIELTIDVLPSWSSGSECTKRAQANNVVGSVLDRRGGTRRPRSLGIAVRIHMLLP